jgi:hypothetical protein
MIHDIGKDIIANLQVNRFVETGTFIGETVSIVCGWMQDLDTDFGTIAERVTNERLGSFFTRGMVDYPVFKNSRSSARTRIYSIDIDTEKQEMVKGMFSSNPNVNIINDLSDKYIKNAIDKGEFSDRDNFMFYLDAHWGNSWPLRDEIKQVLRLKRSIIVVDDFIVPRHPFWGFDVYKTKLCGWYYISDLFKKVKTEVFYPKKPNREGRGSVIIFVGYQKDEIAFMNGLPCFRPLLFKGSPLITLAAKMLVVVLVYTGLYNHLLRIYLCRKWGSVENSPSKKLLNS